MPGGTCQKHTRCAQAAMTRAVWAAAAQRAQYSVTFINMNRRYRQLYILRFFLKKNCILWFSGWQRTLDFVTRSTRSLTSIVRYAKWLCSMHQNRTHTRATCGK